MGWAEMVVAIIVVITIGKVLQARYGAPDQTGRSDPAETVENRQLRQEIQALRERVQVLERVITDTHSSSDLDREIERLRDRS
jgi:hypothetical protein